jgi:hypothetical protein
MRKAMLLAMCLICAGFGGVAWAQGGSTHAPGFVDFVSKDIVGDATPHVEVNLGKALLRIMAGAAGEADPDLQVFLTSLHEIRVRTFEDLPKTKPSVVEKVKVFVDRLTGTGGWTTLVWVPQEDQRVDILIKEKGENIAGLAVFVVGDDELVFVNIVGDINPETFGATLARLGIKGAGGKLDLSQISKMLGNIIGRGEQSSSAAAPETGEAVEGATKEE